MVTIRELTDRPCFMCGSTEDIAEAKFKDGTVVPLCRDHTWKKLKEMAKKPRAKGRDPKAAETAATPS